MNCLLFEVFETYVSIFLTYSLWRKKFSPASNQYPCQERGERKREEERGERKQRNGVKMIRNGREGNKKWGKMEKTMNGIG